MGPRMIISVVGILLALAGACTGRRLGVLLGAASMASAWFLEHPLLRALGALVAFTWTMRLVDLLRAEPWPPWRRVLHVLSVVDSRRLTRAPPRLERLGLAQALAWILVAGAAVGALLAVPVQLVRWGAGLVLVYAVVSALYLLLFVGYRGLGFVTPPLHVNPVLSRSIQEFWGARWARPISDWLGETFFRPYARRRRALTGVVLAFAVSAAFHAYVVWAALGLVDGLPMAGWMCVYFLAQGALMTLERAVKTRSWPRWAGHAWTVAWMVLVSPIFVEPALRVLGL